MEEGSVDHSHLLRIMCATVEKHLEPNYWPDPVVAWWRYEKKRLADQKNYGSKMAEKAEIARLAMQKLTTREQLAITETERAKAAA